MKEGRRPAPLAARRVEAFDDDDARRLGEKIQVTQLYE